MANEKEQKFTFRPSWDESIALMDEKNYDVARKALIAFCLGKEVDIMSLPEGTRVLLNEAKYCLDFDRKYRRRRTDAGTGTDADAGTNTRTRTRTNINNARTHGHADAGHEVNEVNEVTEGSEATEGNQCNEVTEEGLTSSSTTTTTTTTRAKDSFGEIREAYDYWNVAIERKKAKLYIVKRRRINRDRVKKIRKLLEDFGLENFKKAVNNAVESQYLNEIAANAPVGFDWFLTPGNFEKTLEGNFEKVYQNKPRKQPGISCLTDEEMKNDPGF